MTVLAVKYKKADVCFFLTTVAIFGKLYRAAGIEKWQSNLLLLCGLSWSHLP